MKQCDCCGYTTKTSKYQRDSTREDPGLDLMYLCALCAETPAGNTVQYPREGQDILRTICYVGNAILSEMRK